MLHVKSALLALIGILLFSSQVAQAQVHKADGIIDFSGEYNSTEYSTNNGKWFMNWDDTNLYVAVANSNSNSPTVLYLDLNPLPIVNGGTSADGNTYGYENYDGTNGTLPFRGDAIVYFKKDDSGYNEYRIADKDNWNVTAVRPFSVGFSQGNDNVREIIIPWSSFIVNGKQLTGKPAAFNWLGYAVNTSSYQVTTPAPREGYIGQQKNTIDFVRYFTVPNTNEAGSAFKRGSYTHIGANIDQFGGIDVYDFTMNTPGATITRRINAPNEVVTWNISGNLTVNQGIINTGASTNPIYVNKDFFVSANAQFNLQSNLQVTGNFKAAGGFTVQNSGSVTLNGGAQTVSTSGNNTSFASLNLTGGTKTLLNNLTITQQLSLNDGARLNTGINRLVLAPGSSGLFEGDNGYVIGTVESSATLSSPGSYNFNNTGLTLSIARNGSKVTDYPGFTTVRRLTGTPLTSPTGTSQSIKRQYQIIPTYATNQDVKLTFEYRTYNDNELNSIPETQLRFFRSEDSSGPFERLAPPATIGASSSVEPVHFVTSDTQSTINGYFTLGDGNNPLPVELASFTGQYANNSVLLNWTTASEKNNKGFGVERRVGEGSNWQPVAFVAGKSANGAAYKYVDVAAPQGTVYYRLRQEDNDGTTAYSPVVAVVVAGQVGGATLALSPVPTADVLTISGFGDGKHTAEVYDLRGRRVLTQEISDAQSTLQVSALPSGVYLVRVQGAGSAQKGKFVKL